MARSSLDAMDEAFFENVRRHAVAAPSGKELAELQAHFRGDDVPEEEHDAVMKLAIEHGTWRRGPDGSVEFLR